MPFNIVIPARYGSTRLPGKALLPIADKPMVAWVWERAMDAGANRVVVATDDERIADEMLSRGADVVMTRADHVSGTDRLAEVSRHLGWADDAIVINLQGDEPLMPVANIRRVAAMLEENPGAGIATLMEPLERAEADEPVYREGRYERVWQGTLFLSKLYSCSARRQRACGRISSRGPLWLPGRILAAVVGLGARPGRVE